MKTKIIPAQITTVEDKIAGNLSLAQILLLMFPIFLGSVIYLLFPPASRLNLFKFFLMIFIFVVSGFFSLRFHERLIINWIILILRFNLRPKYYLFNKNDTYLREIDTLDEVKRKNKKTKKKIVDPDNIIGITEKDEVMLNEFLRRRNFNLTFKIKKKGGLSVISQKN